MWAHWCTARKDGIVLSGKKGIRFKGHETFTIREGWLNKGLTEIEKNPLVFNTNYGADALGMGPNMAKSLRYWLRCADLTEESAKNGVHLTKVGKLILDEDPYIEDMFTLWLIHCRIAANDSQATAWNLFFNRFSYEEFDKNELISEMKELALLTVEEISSEKKVAEASVVSDCDAILHMYVKQGKEKGTPEEKNVSPFAKLELVRLMDNKYIRKQPDLNCLPEAVVLYLLVGCLKDRTSINMDELLAVANGPGKLLQLKRNALAELLENLEKKEQVIMNRTAGLNMVYLPKKLSAEEVVELYYRGNI